MDELTSEDAAELLLPDVPIVEQKKIGERIVRAHELRDTANEREASAIRQVEELIAGN